MYSARIPFRNGDKSLRVIRSNIRLSIVKAFDEAGIVIAFPQRDIHLHTQKPLAIKMER